MRSQKLNHVLSKVANCLQYRLRVLPVRRNAEMRRMGTPEASYALNLEVISADQYCRNLVHGDQEHRQGPTNSTEENCMLLFFARDPCAYVYSICKDLSTAL